MTIFAFGINLANRFSFNFKFGLIAVAFFFVVAYASHQLISDSQKHQQKLLIEAKAIDILSQLKPYLYAEERLEKNVWVGLQDKLDVESLSLSLVTADALSQDLSDNKTKLFDSLNRVNRDVLANSGLKTEANKIAHFLVEIAYLQHPKLNQLIQVLIENARQVVKQGSFTPDSFLALTDAQNKTLHLLNEVNQYIDILQLERPELAKKLSSSSKQLVNFTINIKKDILDPDDIQWSVQDLNQALSQTEKSLIKLLEITLTEISLSIEARITQAQKKQNIIIVLISILSFSLLYMLTSIALSIRKNAEQISRFTNQVAHADLSASLPIKSRDDLGGICSYLNDTVDALDKKIRQFSLANKHIQAATQQVADSVSESFQEVEKQQEQTDLVASATEEMSYTVAEVAKNAEIAAHATLKANEATNQGKQFVFETIDKIDTLASNINHAGDTVDQLNCEVDKISSVLEVITSIADQTNLLALNAAIEAARAGEHGRGFAVVADEVRNLAKKTQESTKEINAMIVTLQQGAKSSVDVMKNSQKDAQESVDMIGQAGEMLENINTAIEQISDQNNQVATATEQQSAVAKEISVNTENLKATTSAIYQSTEYIVKANGELETETQVLSDHISAFKLKA